MPPRSTVAIDTREDLLERNRELQLRLDEAEEIVRALRNGEVDAVVSAGPDGDRVYTLRGADEAYRVMVQGMADGALTLTPDGLILFSNDQFAVLVRRPLERVIGSRIQEFVVAEDQDALAALLGARGSRKAELLVRTDGATGLPVYLSIDNLFLDDVECLCAIVTDLTEQKRNEEIVAAERLARSILEQAAEAILVLDAEGRITRASHAADLLAGEPVLHRSFDDVFPIALNSGTAYPFRQILSASGELGRFNGLEAGAAMPDGREVKLLLSAAKLSGPDSGLLGCIVTLTDITERMVAEQVLRESQARFRRLYEADIIGIVCADAERILEANDLFLEMVGYSRTDLDAGQIQCPEITPREYRHLDERALEELARTQSAKPFEKEYLRKDGTRLPILIGATLLQASPLRYLCFILDLTERKRLEKKLSEKQKLESIGLLAGGIAHDFNNLLVGILGNASLAREMMPAGSPANRALEGVVQASERAAHLTRQMLAYSGKGQFVIEAVNFSKLAEEVTKLVQSSISNKIVVHLDLGHDLPPVEADAGQMQQVVMNLVINAAEAIGEENGLITVRTCVQTVDAAFIRDLQDGLDIEAGNYVCLEVRDTGCGMDEATKTRIFDPFFTTKFTGRGLGLAAVSGVVRGHKGAIKVLSAPGKGSTFLVVLPAATSGAVQPQAPSEPIHTGRGGGETILVVDDEEVVLKTARMSLERRGYTVLQAENGRAAVEIFRRDRDRVSLIVLDLSMPGMSGQETLIELRKIKPEIEVIVSSGYSESEVARIFAVENVSGFLQKPYTSARLAEKIGGVITARIANGSETAGTAMY